jgi:hypothetical protein
LREGTADFLKTCQGLVSATLPLSGRLSDTERAVRSAELPEVGAAESSKGWEIACCPSVADEKEKKEGE